MQFEPVEEATANSDTKGTREDVWMAVDKWIVWWNGRGDGDTIGLGSGWFYFWDDIAGGHYLLVDVSALWSKYLKF